MKKYILPLSLLLMFSACDQEEINTNTEGITEKEYRTGGLAYGSSLQSMEQMVVPIGSPVKTTGPGNDLQASELISSGAYIGFFGNNNTWGGNIEATWNFPDHRMAYIYDIFYANAFKPWNEIKKLSEKSDDPSDKRVMAVADIIKIAAWIKATDAFGPIVYTRAGNGDVAPKLDSQEEVYKAMLADLEKVSDLLNKSNDLIAGEYDLIYSGKSANWVKLANSLMLRLAVRVHFKDAELAKQYVAKALDPQRGGVMEMIADEAKIGTSDKMPLLNPMMPSVSNYGETRMGATIWSYLEGYNDGRIGKYFTKGKYDGNEDFFAIAPANLVQKQDKPNTAYYASMPNVGNDSPMYWMRASEVYFLRAEAALFELSSDDAQEMYEMGVKTSFEEWGAKGVENYLRSRSLPKAMTDYKYGTYFSYRCDISEGNVSPNWEDVKSDKDKKEQRLQKIITQKYLALYPNAVEAWTEYRRTGYPYIMKPMDPRVQGNIGADQSTLAPERFKFASTEYNTNENMNEVPALLGGPDQGATRMWWVRDNRPQQTFN